LSLLESGNARGKSVVEWHCVATTVYQSDCNSTHIFTQNTRSGTLASPVLARSKNVAGVHLKISRRISFFWLSESVTEVQRSAFAACIARRTAHTVRWEMSNHKKPMLEWHMGQSGEALSEPDVCF
jgi:hypothetical protein